MARFRIKELCRVAGITQKTLAEMIGTSESVVSQISRGTFNPSLTTLEKIASVLNVSVEELFASTASAPIFGIVESSGRFFKLSAPKQYIETEAEIEGIVNTPYFSNKADAEKAVASFVQKCLESDEVASMFGRICASVLFCVSITNDFVGDGKAYKRIVLSVNSLRFGVEQFLFSSFEYTGDLECLLTDICGCLTRSI